MPAPVRMPRRVILSSWFLLLLIVAATCASPTSAAIPKASGPKHTQPVSGVHVFETASYSDVGLDGNSTAILTSDGVVVFDANGTPQAARDVLAQIRKLTKQPVKVLVLSHWHWDHWYGAEVYAQAFPGLTIVAHEKSRELMAGPAVEFNKPGLEQQLPAHIQQIEDAATQTAKDLKTVEADRWKAHAAADRAFLEAKRTAKLTLPTKTFTDSLDISLGGRRMIVRHPGRAITPGDAYLDLPGDQLVITGDLLVNPITFALFCDPSGWISALEQIDSLDARWIVPGHGAPMRSEKLLHDTHELLVQERKIALRVKAEGRSIEFAKDEVLRDMEVRRLREAIVGLDTNLQAQFDVYLVDWFVRRVYDEADGKLDDRIPKME